MLADICINIICACASMHKSIALIMVLKLRGLSQENQTPILVPPAQIYQIFGPPDNLFQFS